VGHLARLIEAAGIPTVIIAVQAFRDRLEAMTPPRLLLTPYLMGRPLGRPHQPQQHRAVLQSALALLEQAEQAGTIRDFMVDRELFSPKKNAS